MRELKGLITLFVAAIVLVSSFTAFAESTEYRIDELHMKTAIPNEMLAITRDCKKTDSYFSQFGFDYKETLKMFKQANVYLQAIKQDGSLTLSITMTKDKNSEKIGNYNRLEDKELKDIMSKYLNDDAYKSGSIVESNGVKYINLAMRTKSGKKTIQSQQYCTVANGMSIAIILDAPAGKKLKSADKTLVADVVADTYITDNNVFEKYRELIVYGGITLLAVILVIVILLVLLKKLKNPNRKHKHIVHELAHEHQISETTQIPRQKSVFNMTKPTMSFMKNYEPLKEKGKKTNDDIVDEILEETKDIKQAEPERASEKEMIFDEKPFEEKIKPAVETTKREVPLAEKIISDKSKKISEPVEEEYVPIAEPMEFPEKKKEEKPVLETEIETADEVVEEKLEKGNEYFEEVPEGKDMYAYSDVDTAVDEYSAAKAESQMIREERKETLETVKNVLKAVGRGILAVLGAIWSVICFIAVHLKYFCINVYRAFKKSRAKKKREKAEEERRRRIAEQRRRSREAQKARQRQNANRNEGDLVKVHSSGERRPQKRPSAQTQRRVQQRPQQRPQHRTQSGRGTAPSNRQNRGHRDRY